MRLNTLQPKEGSRPSKKRLGRGIGSGLGKTCGRGHKGQKARAGGFHKIGFEGGQMPLQRRLPKYGFNSWKKRYAKEIRLSELNQLMEDVIDMAVLKQHALISDQDRFIKIIKKGEIGRALILQGLKVTKGAKAAIEQAGGKVEEIDG